MKFALREDVLDLYARDAAGCDMIPRQCWPRRCRCCATSATGMLCTGWAGRMAVLGADIPDDMVLGLPAIGYFRRSRKVWMPAAVSGKRAFSTMIVPASR